MNHQIDLSSGKPAVKKSLKMEVLKLKKICMPDGIHRVTSAYALA